MSNYHWIGVLKCSKCKQLRPLDEFRMVESSYMLKTGEVRKHRARRKYCKDCHNQQCYRPYSERRLKEVNYIFWTMNHYFCSDGTKVTEAQIRRKLYEYYFQEWNDGWEFYIRCKGCEDEWAQGHAHIIPKARCKNLRKTELIWDRENWFFACHKCNAIAENVSSEAITKLKNFERIKRFLSLHDVERYSKLPDSAILNDLI